MEVLQGENDNHLKRIYTDLKKTMGIYIYIYINII